MTSRVRLALFGTALAGAVYFAGCGLGYLDAGAGGTLTFRIENGTTTTGEVTITVAVPQASIDTASTEPSGLEGVEASGDLSTGKAAALTAQLQYLDETKIVRVGEGGVTTGRVTCGERVTITAVTGEGSSTAVEFGGAGTGTPGFDAGSVGLTGERFLISGTDYACGDTILVRLEGIDRGSLEVVPEGQELPDPLIPPDDGGTDDPSGPPGSSSMITLRLENATPTAADITIDRVVSGTDGTGEDIDATENGPITVRVSGGQYTTGEVLCGQDYVVSGSMVDAQETPVLLTGDGTGTAGFDSASIGFNGERLLLFNGHYACGESIVVRISDDGSGIGASDSADPLGVIGVFSSGDPLPPPDLPDPDEEPDGTEALGVTFVLTNDTESTIQANFAAGNGTLGSSHGTDVSSQFDVRVPTGQSSTGTADCAKEYIIAVAHLEPTQTTIGEITSVEGPFPSGSGVNYHAVVLTGDGTGTEGWDENSLAIFRGRLIQLGTHYQCGDTITVTVTATNNTFVLDTDTHAPVLDENGNPEITYGVGDGTLQATPAGGS